MLASRSRRQSRLRFSRFLNIYFLSRVATITFIGLILGSIFTIGLFAWYSRDLPTPGKLKASNLSQSTKIYDRHGTVLYDIFNEENRTYVELKDVSPYLKEATLAIEDKDFYQNKGFSIIGYLRAARNALLSRGIAGGGSTLTQQLVKNTLLSSEQTLVRKIKELILAIQVDRKYKKDQILELYLNVVPYGGTAVGIEAASESYFGKKAKDLNLVESAILAGLPQRPSYYSPYGQNPKAYIARTKDVLRRMREDSYITRKQEAQAIKSLEYISFQPRSYSIKAPHFSFYIKDQLIKKYGEELVESGGLRVTTTLDYNLQKEAQKIVNEEVLKAKNLYAGNGASVVVNPKNGEILSLVGSRDFFATESAIPSEKGEAFEGQFDVITQGFRQPGSTIKPVTYVTALEKGYTASTVIMDVKTVFPAGDGKDYTPKNYNEKFNGPMQMRFALANSINIPAVKMLAMVGIKNMLKTAYEMGIKTLEPSDENMRRFGLSLTLGGGEVVPLDLAVSYSAFANGGFRVEPVSILKVTDPKGKVLFEQKQQELANRVISEEAAFIISHILLDNNARSLTFGTNSYLNIRGRTVAAKTGTTDDRKDNWTIGWTPGMLVLSWVGNNNNKPMRIASGVTGAAPIWRRIMLESLKDTQNEEFKVPQNVVSVSVDSLGGGLPVDGQATRSEYFIKGTEPVGPGPIYKQLRISKAENNKLASPSEIEKREYDIKSFIVFAEQDPVSTDGKNKWQEGIDEWLKENYKDDSKYHPPTEQSTRVILDPTPTPTLTPTPSVTSTPIPTQTP